MGVTGLWKALEASKEVTAFQDLKGKLLAVDLSLWLCECAASSIKCNSDLYPNMYIRNIFYRTAYCLKNGVRLIFVIDGLAPELKSEEMGRRIKIKTVKNRSRPTLAGPVAECCTLFDAMGVPYVKSASEAEALCAILNEAGVVDGCVTTDGDAFLYGATVVYRDFAVDSKTISCYKMDNIRANLEIDRSGLIALALLNGCDYNNAGTKGIGPAHSIRYLEICAAKKQDPVEILRLCLSTTEEKLRESFQTGDKKVLSVFANVRENLTPTMFEDIVNEFMDPIGESCRQKVIEEAKRKKVVLWKGLAFETLVDFFREKLYWGREQSEGKFFPLLARYCLMEGNQLVGAQKDALPVPTKIVRRRVVEKENCFEVEWSWFVVKYQERVQRTMTTVEPVALFSKSCPELVATFETCEKQKKQTKPTTRAKRAVSVSGSETNVRPINNYFEPLPVAASTVDDLIDSLQKISLTASNGIAADSIVVVGSKNSAQPDFVQPSLAPVVTNDENMPYVNNMPPDVTNNKKTLNFPSAEEFFGVSAEDFFGISGSTDIIPTEISTNPPFRPKNMLDAIFGKKSSVSRKLRKSISTGNLI